MRLCPLLTFVFISLLMFACEPTAPEKKENKATATGEATPEKDKGSQPGADVAAEGEAHPTPVDNTEPAKEAASDFAVHEWGMMRHTADQLLVSTSPPTRSILGGLGKDQIKPRDPTPDFGNLIGDEPGKANTGFGLGMSGVGAGGGKPLIMLHPGPTFDASTEISVGVKLVGGTFREVWPTPAQGAQPEHSASYSWEQVHATAESCGRELAPSCEHVACTSIAAEGICEAAEMGTYLSPVPSCLSVGDVKTPALVYNGLFPGVPAPLVLSEGEAPTLENRTAQPFGPLYIHQGDALFRVESIEANSTLPLTQMLPFDGELKVVLKKDLLAKGLTEGEADSFVAAWSPDVLRQPWVWQVFGFYSAEGVEAIAPMTVTPQPKALVRVMAVTVE